MNGSWVGSWDLSVSWTKWHGCRRHLFVLLARRNGLTMRRIHNAILETDSRRSLFGSQTAYFRLMLRRVGRWRRLCTSYRHRHHRHWLNQWISNNHPRYWHLHRNHRVHNRISVVVKLIWTSAHWISTRGIFVKSHACDWDRNQIRLIVARQWSPRRGRSAFFSLRLLSRKLSLLSGWSWCCRKFWL